MTLRKLEPQCFEFLKQYIDKKFNIESNILIELGDTQGLRKAIDEVNNFKTELGRLKARYDRGQESSCRKDFLNLRLEIINFFRNTHEATN